MANEFETIHKTIKQDIGVHVTEGKDILAVGSHNMRNY